MVPSAPGPEIARRDRLPPRLLPVLCFAAAHLFLILAFAAMAPRPALLTGFFYQPRTVAIVHLVTLGWIGLSILGAIYVVGPLALRMPMPARWIDNVALGFSVIGVAGMVAHFHLEEYGGMAWSAGMVAAGILHVAVRALAGLRSAPIQRAVKLHIVLAFLNALAAATVGILLGVHKVRPFLPGAPLSIVYGHAHLAAIGWAGMMVAGTGYRLLPMVLPSAMPRGRGLYLSAVLLEAGAVGLFLSFVMQSAWRIAFALLVLGGFGAFLLHVQWMKRRLRRPPPGMPRPDYGAMHSVQALSYAAVSAVCGLILALSPPRDADTGFAAAYGVFGLIGFLSQMVVGIGSRILPMFAACHANLNACAVRPPNYAHDMPVRRLQAPAFYLWTAGVPALAAGLWGGSAPLVAAGATLLLGAAILGAINTAMVLRHAFVVPRPAVAGAQGCLLVPGLLLLALFVSCGQRPGPPAAAGGPARGPRSGVIEMAERLEAITRDLDPIKNKFLNTERVKILRGAIERAGGDPERRARLTIDLADELLKVGSAEQAIALMQPFLRSEVRATGFAPPIGEVRKFLAVACYRLGVQENCMGRPNAERCLLPIRGAGVHTEPRGARAAIRELSALLRADPEDLGARWLLNMSYMILGKYPEEVPRPWLIPPPVFASEHDIKRFPNVADRAGLDVFNHAGGGIMEDFDGDRLLDIMVSSMGTRDQLHLFRNQGDGTFADRTEAAGLIGEVGGLNMVHADFDNDGDADVLVLRGGWMMLGGRYPNSLLRNDGEGTFEDVTEEAGILSHHPTQTAAWGDYDNDGWLDLFIGNESLGPDDPHPSELYHNDRDGTFSDATSSFTFADLGYVKGAAWGDYDNDGWQDLYVAVKQGRNFLFRNGGKPGSAGQRGGGWRFTDVTFAAGVVGPASSFPTWFWDYDNDGWLDLFVAGYLPTSLDDAAGMYLGRPTRTDMPRLYRNARDGTFSDVTRAVRLDRVALPMGANFGDLDNDGWPDAYFGTGQPNFEIVIPNRLFRNAEGRFFQDVTMSANMGHLAKGHGVAFGDIDNDGDQDIFEQMGGFYEADVAQNVLYENPGHGNRWITLKLEGRRSNRSAIGTRIRVRVTTPTGKRDIHATVGWGGSFGGNSLQQEIGLGDAISIVAIEVSWPATGKVQIFRDVEPDRVYRIVEGEDRLTVSPVRTFKL
jgi:hypothetical protein